EQAVVKSLEETPVEDFPTLKYAAGRQEREANAAPSEDDTARSAEAASIEGSLEELRIESESLAVPQVEVAARPEPVIEPRVTDKAEPVQEPPKKVGFWQRLFGRRRKK
ncbi:MAG: hypothetical protein ACRDHW_20070, partial [Ktedonobacteraceae bacterium]